MHLYKCISEKGHKVLVYAEDGLEALALANKEFEGYEFTKIELIAEPVVIVPETFHNQGGTSNGKS